MGLIVPELFAGTGPISKAFEEYGHKSYSVEWGEDFDDITLYADINTVTADDVMRMYGRSPDIIWASPDCSTFMKGLPRYTVTYCQYGDTRMKPTDIWTNHPNPKFKPMCKNGDTCHERAPRGAKTGTQGLKGAKARAVIPHELCKHIVKICEE